MSTLGQASVAAVRQYLRLAQSHGLDLPPLLREAGLATDILTEDHRRIDGLQFQALIRALLQRISDPLLGLHSGDFVQPGSYSVLGYITMSCATLGEAIARIAPYEKLVGDMGITRVHVIGDEIRIRWTCAYPDPDVRPHMVDNVFASWINYARWLGNAPDTHPLRVELEREAPDTSLCEEYRTRWHCPVLFGQRHNLIAIARELLDAPLRQPDPELRQTLESHAQSKLAVLEDDVALVTRVREIVRAQLLQGITRQDLIADHLNMTARTLQRKLGQESTSYQMILDEERQARAEHLLRQTAQPIPDIALSLGFAEVSSFHRSFKKWTGKTPGEYRQTRP